MVEIYLLAWSGCRQYMWNSSRVHYRDLCPKMVEILLGLRVVDNRHVALEWSRWKVKSHSRVLVIVAGISRTGQDPPPGQGAGGGSEGKV